MMRGRVIHQSEGGSTITAITLTPEQRSGLTCSKEAFDRACDEALAYYRSIGDVRSQARSRRFWQTVDLIAMLAFACLVLQWGAGWLTLFLCACLLRFVIGHQDAM